MKKSEIKDILHRLLLCFVVLIFVFLTLLILFSILDAINTKDENWISFWGSIFGGLLTLIGVAWTINDQNKKRKEDQELRDKERREELAIRYKPLIKFSCDKKLISSNEDIHTLSFNIVNIGRGEANNIEIVFNEDVEIINYNTDYKNRYYISTFPNNESHPIEIKYNKVLEGKNVTESDRIIEVSIYYKDLFSVYSFTTKGQIFIHSTAWPHIIEDINGEIISKKNKNKENKHREE